MSDFFEKRNFDYIICCPLISSQNSNIKINTFSNCNNVIEDAEIIIGHLLHLSRKKDIGNVEIIVDSTP